MICKSCNAEKVESEFLKCYGSGKEYRRKVCAACMYERRKKYTSTEHAKAVHKKCVERFKQKHPNWHKNYLLKKRFGISFEKYTELLARQNGVCAICATTDPSSGNSKVKYFSVDHCHKTGVVRGLLCLHCNSVLGYAKDNTDVLQSAIDYLRKE